MKNSTNGTTKEAKRVTKTGEVDKRGRRHLDNSLPGRGTYLPRLTVTARQSDLDLLDEIAPLGTRGQSSKKPNRSQGFRMLADFYLEHHPEVAEALTVA